MIRRAPTAALAALLWAAGLVSAQAVPPGPAATVNGVAIARAELDALVKRLGPSAAPQPEAHRRLGRAEMPATPIENGRMRQFLEGDPPTPKVEPAEIDRRLKEMEKRLKKDGKSVEELCHDTHQTPEQLKAAIADHIRWSGYVARHANAKALQAFYQGNK